MNTLDPPDLSYNLFEKYMPVKIPIEINLQTIVLSNSLSGITPEKLRKPIKNTATAILGTWTAKVFSCCVILFPFFYSVLDDNLSPQAK